VFSALAKTHRQQGTIERQKKAMSALLENLVAHYD